MCFLSYIQTEPLDIREYNHDADHIQINLQENRKQEGHIFILNTPTNTHAVERSVVRWGIEYFLFLFRSDSGAGLTEAERIVPPLERTQRGDFGQKRKDQHEKTQVQVQVKEYNKTSDGKTMTRDNKFKSQDGAKMNVGRIRKEE